MIFFIYIASYICSWSRKFSCRFPEQGAFRNSQMVDRYAFSLSSFRCLGLSSYRHFRRQVYGKMPFVLHQGRGRPTTLGDGLHLDWTGRFLYLFPLFPLLPRVLHKLRVILVAPWWPWQNWFPLLLQMSNRSFLLFPQTPELLYHGPHAIRHHDIPSLTLTAWRIFP